MDRPKIVIVGAGFAGLSALLVLLKRKVNASIMLIDKNAHFEYIPSLHLCLAKPSYANKIRISLKEHYGKWYRQDEILDIKRHEVVGKKKKYPFDYLIYATGSVTNYYGSKEFEKFGFPVKSIAHSETINKKLGGTQKIVVIGGGYTGVEIASVLASQTDKQVTIVHPGERLLHTLHPMVGKKARKYIQRNGGKVVLGRKAKNMAKDSVTLDNGDVLMSDMTIMSAGIRPCDEAAPDTELSPCLALEKYPHIYLCGDVARSGILATAHNAMIEGRRVGSHLADTLQGKVTRDQISRDWRILAVALGRYRGLLTFGDSFAIPTFLTGLAKWVIERRVMFEFKYKIMLPI